MAEKERKIITKIVDTLFRSQANGQRTHSARTKIVETSFRSHANRQCTHSAQTKNCGTPRPPAMGNFRVDKGGKNCNRVLKLCI